MGLELRRLGLNKLSRLEPKPLVIRYEHEKPGDMIHLHIKKLGKIGVGTASPALITPCSRLPERRAPGGRPSPGGGEEAPRAPRAAS